MTDALYVLAGLGYVSAACGLSLLAGLVVANRHGSDDGAPAVTILAVMGIFLMAPAVVFT